MPDVTQILLAIQAGDDQAAQELWPLVYDELRKLANQQLAHEPGGQTLQPTALVHEAYLRLIGVGANVQWEGRAHFFGAAANAMRRILIDAARRKRQTKRGGERTREFIDPEQIAEPQLAEELLALDEALSALATTEPLIAQLVTLRYFGGLSLKEAAQALHIAPRTADSHWAYAKAWLLEEMTRD